MSLTVDFILSERGNNMLVVNDFKFMKRKILKSGQILWTCVVNNCQAKCHTEGGKLVLNIYVINIDIVEFL